MKTLTRILALSGLLALMAFSCGQKNPISPNNQLGAKESFPNQVGDSWTYSVFDSIHKTTQTVVMKIVGDTLFKNGKTYKIWQYDLSGKKANYVNINGDTVGIYTPFIFKLYVFPLNLNKSWFTTKVIKIETVSVPAGIFHNCYVIHRLISGYNYGLDEYVWLKPRIGIIKRQTYERYFGPATYHVWKLMDYKLTN